MSEKKHEIWALCVLTVSLLVLFSILSYSSQKILPYFFPSNHFDFQPGGPSSAQTSPLAFDRSFWDGRLRVCDCRPVGELASFQRPSMERVVAPSVGVSPSRAERNDAGALHWLGSALWPEFKTGRMDRQKSFQLSGGRLSALGSHILLFGRFLSRFCFPPPSRSGRR